MATLRIADSVGRVLGDRYRLTRPLGTGASAYVYVAEDVTLRRRVAIKVLHPGLADDEAFLRRFRAEARAVAALHHPNILRVYDWGEDDGSPYLVSDLLEGGSLRAILDRGELLSPAQAAAVGAGAAEALAHAHRRGLVHRDIKPANLLFDEEGRVCIADFGLARALAESTVTEPAGAVVGTARYAAPEQVRGRLLDARADVYSLALVLVEATTGIVPFAADTILATLMGRLEEPLRLPGGTGPLAAIIEAAGTIDPADRLDAGGMAAALQAMARDLPPATPLPLVGLLTAAEVERNVDPTQLRGRPGRARSRTSPSSVLLDPAVAAAADGLDPIVDGPASRRAGAGRDGSWPPPPPPLGRRDGGDGRGAPRAGPDAWHVGGGGVAATPDERDETVSIDLAAVRFGGAPDGAEVDPDRDGSEGDDWDESTGVDDAPPPTGGDDAPMPGRGAASARRREGADSRDLDGRGRQTWRSMLLAVVIMLVVVAGGVSGWVLTHQPAPTATVPSLHGETETEAAATLARLHLVLTVAGKAYDVSAPAGTVTGQTPAGGRLREHGSVAVFVSLGPQPVEVPTRLAGLGQAEATKLINAVGLELGQVTEAPSLTVPQGDVVSASPAGGTLLPGQVVALVISTGKPHVTVPALSAAALESYAAAAAALHAAHLGAHQELVYSNTVAAGAVVLVQPAAGTTQVYGSTVTVEVSKGPHVVVVPQVAGDTVAGADVTLGDDGFVVTGVTGNPGGTVIGTTPGVGRTVLYGSSVQIVTG